MKPTVYVGHRFNFKGMWPQVVSYLHNNGGTTYSNLPIFKTEEDIEKEHEIGLISEETMDQYIFINNMYNSGSYNFIAFEYFRAVAQQYGLEIFIHNDHNNTDLVTFIDIGLSLKSEVAEYDHSLLCSADTAIHNIDYLHRLPLDELQIFSYCITRQGPQIFYIIP